MADNRGPLAGIRVLELGSSVAGPFCGRLFADFLERGRRIYEGADVRLETETVDGGWDAAEARIQAEAQRPFDLVAVERLVEGLEPRKDHVAG